MNKLTKTAALFLAAVSVYSGQAFLAKAASAADPVAEAKTPAGDVKPLEHSSDPFSTPATQPATQPSTPESVGDGTPINPNDVAISETGTVEIHVNDANLVEVLRMLSLQSQKNIVASKEVGGKVTANLYGVTVREALAYE